MANVLLGTLLFCSICVATTTAQAPSPQTSVPAVDSQAPSPQTSVPAADSQTPSPQTSVPAADSQAPSPQTSVPAADSQAPSPQASVPVVDVPQEAFVIDWDHVINVLLAGVVGILGALSFYYGVYTGFINPDSREKTLKYFSGSIWIKLHYTGMFCLLGGVVAAVFQAAQASTFAPIQAFVLGATWPSVVTRIMSGGAEPTKSARDLADAASNAIPRPTSSKTAADAEVII
jgi:hypothetical protein